MRKAVVGLLVGAAFVLSGCQYLLGGMMGGPVILPPIGGSFDPGEFGSFDPGDFGSFDPNDPMFSLPPPIATFLSGTATIATGGKTTTLDRLSGTAAQYEDFGTEVAWTDGDGMYVRFYGEADSAFGAGFLTLDRIADGQHWSAADPTRCVVKVSQDDAKAVVGTASCKGLRWVDAMSSAGVLEPAYITGQAPFDAEVTFEAKP